MIYNTHLIHVFGLVAMVTAGRDSHGQEDKEQDEEIRSHSEFVKNQKFVETPK